MKRKMDVWQVISFAILGLYALFLILPLFRLLRNSVIGPEGGFSLEYFRTFFTSKTYYGTLINSFWVSLTSTITSLILGTLFAYFYNLFEIRGRTFLQTIALLLKYKETAKAMRYAAAKAPEARGYEDPEELFRELEE